MATSKTDPIGSSLRNDELEKLKVRMRIFLILVFLSTLSGCALLFVQKGSMTVGQKQVEAVPTAPSLIGQIEAQEHPRHVVKSGDTLGKISRKYYGNSRYAKAIAKRNKLDPSAPLKTGRVLELDAPEAVVSTRNARMSVTPAFAEKTIGGQTYTIEVSGVGRKDRPKANRAFAKGEYLRFVVKFFAVTGGYATLEVRDVVRYESRPCFKLVCTAKSAFPVSSVYTVDEYVESLFDAVDYFPWRFHKKVVEGRYHEDSVVTYDQLKHRATRKKNQDPIKEQNIPPFVQDILSCFYYARLVDVVPGDKFSIPTHAGDKNYEMVVEVLRRETQRVGAGKFNCLVVRPHVKYDNVFQNKGEILLWITDDERRLPILIRSKILVGNVDVELIEARLPKLQP